MVKKMTDAKMSNGQKKKMYKEMTDKFHADVNNNLKMWPIIQIFLQMLSHQGYVDYKYVNAEVEEDGSDPGEIPAKMGQMKIWKALSGMWIQMPMKMPKMHWMIAMVIPAIVMCSDFKYLNQYIYITKIYTNIYIYIYI